jgi:hypothetical protein
MNFQLHVPGRFTPGGRARGIRLIGDWMGPRADLDDVEKKIIIFPGPEIRPLRLSKPAASRYTGGCTGPRHTHMPYD